MSVRIRLTRMGKKKQPTYRVVVTDSRRPRDGAYIEQIGVYDPRRAPSLIEIDNDRALDWLRKGAQPSDRARKLLEISGAWTRFRIAKGDIHTIDDRAQAPAPAVVPAPEAPADAVDETAAVATEPFETVAETAETAARAAMDPGEVAPTGATEAESPADVAGDPAVAETTDDAPAVDHGEVAGTAADDAAGDPAGSETADDAAGAAADPDDVTATGATVAESPADDAAGDPAGAETADDAAGEAAIDAGEVAATEADDAAGEPADDPAADDPAASEPADEEKQE